ncbi:MAG: hypothetical protein JNJ60_18335 [Rhodocyclaceae bacterium]|nr:hypothetical protein [Rhodocyclaceae bacterium]
MLAWFNCTEVDEFARTLSAELVSRLPPVRKGKSTAWSAGKERKAIDHCLGLVKQFVSTHSMNFYKKARLANTLKWALKDAGYADDFVESTTKVIVIAVATHRA